MENVPFDEILDALRSVVDPELGLDIVELGLIHEVEIDDDDGVRVTMLAPPSDPDAHGALAAGTEDALTSVPGVSGAVVRVLAEPVWTPERLSETARRQLGES